MLLNSGDMNTIDVVDATEYLNALSSNLNGLAGNKNNIFL